MKNYIGFATSPHDTSLAIVDKHGELVHAEAAERPLQIKRAWGNAPDHINYIKDLVGKYCDPSLDVVTGRSWSKNVAGRYSLLVPILNYKIRTSDMNNRKRWSTHKYMAFTHKSVLNHATAGLEFAFCESRTKVERKYFEHHLTHAATAAFTSGLDEGVCVVIDGFGEGSSIAAFALRDGKLNRIKGVSAAWSSLGLFYADMCEVCGFDPVKGEEWKVMGLAAYGKLDRKLYDLMRPVLRVKGLSLRSEKNSTRNFDALLEMRRGPNVPALQYADFAATVQILFTEVLHELLRNIYDLKISDKLILSGGCALNSSANGTILENTPFRELFVNSAPADDGNSIGAAYLAYYADNPYVRRGSDVLSPYLGSSMKRSALENLRKFGGLRSEQLDDDALCYATAKALSEGKLIGWVQGKAEFGPRALGNRSILADPRRLGVKERINAEVKFREEFRPFAPSVLHEHGPAYFENYQFSPYMERTLRFKDAVRDKVPGVVHVDGTGRLQSVTAKLNPQYYRLINAFNDITGVPLLLNTSFNVMGKPIVHSVEDAVAVFQTSGLDLLVIENTVFVKDAEYRLATRRTYEQDVVHA